MIRLQSICRLCLLNVESDCTKILIKLSESQRDKFEELTGLELPLTEEYPDNTCTDCSDHLENFYFFKHQLIRKQADLKQFLSCRVRAEVEDDGRLEMVKGTETENNELMEVLFDNRAILSSSSNRNNEEEEEYVTDVIDDGEALLGEDLIAVENEQVIETVAREELIYEKPKPQLVLTPKFLYTRDMARISSVLESPLIEVESFNCKICNATFKSKLSHENHMRDSHEKTFICASCGNLYYDKISLNSHLRSHNKKTKYKCTHSNCEKSFKHHHHLINHLRVHDQVSPFGCDECTATFRQRYALTLHKKKHARNFLECQECKSQFLRKSQLERHTSSCDGRFRAYKTRRPKQKKIKNKD